MINKNVADYTNFGGKTNKRVVQAPGGSSSLSLGWDDTSDRRTNQPTSYEQPSYQMNDFLNNKIGQQRYDNSGMHLMQNEYKAPYEDLRPQQYGRKDIQGQIGGQYGYNSFNPITGVANVSKNVGSYQANQQRVSEYPQRNDPLRYGNMQQRNDPSSFYKPSSNSNYKNYQQQQLDEALQQQKHKIESSRSQRQQNANNLYQQPSTNQTRPCVKIHQQKNNNIFGGQQYDYWKNDGHLQNNAGQNKKKEHQYLHERNNQVNGQYKNRGNQIQGQYGDMRNEKTSVKVHNPPGGRTNFTFG